MIDNALAISILLDRREQLLNEKVKAIARFDEELYGLEAAIETLSGKKVWEGTQGLIYDDEHPDYIKSSQEEI